MDDGQQKRLLALVTKSKAKIVLSGYSSELYDDALKGWHKDVTLSQTTSTEKAEEVIWMNFTPRQCSLFDGGTV